MATQKEDQKCFSKPIIASCRPKVLQNALLEHSAIPLTFIKLPFAIKTFVLSIFKWPLKTGFTVVTFSHWLAHMHGRDVAERICLKGMFTSGEYTVQWLYIALSC